MCHHANSRSWQCLFSVQVQQSIISCQEKNFHNKWIQSNVNNLTNFQSSDRCDKVWGKGYCEEKCYLLLICCRGLWGSVGDQWPNSQDSSEKPGSWTFKTIAFLTKLKYSMVLTVVAKNSKLDATAFVQIYTILLRRTNGLKIKCFIFLAELSTPMSQQPCQNDLVQRCTILLESDART